MPRVLLCTQLSWSTKATVHPEFATDEQELDEDEAFARKLQEQEDALATRGRATRGASKPTQKPLQTAQKGPGRAAGQVRGAVSRHVRSSSRLNPQAAQTKQQPSTRGSAGMSIVAL